MNKIEVLISKLTTDHQEALRWFNENKNKKIKGWPKDHNLKYLLVCKPKGIYKPKDIKYALSVRSSLKGPYDDKVFSYEDGSFKLKYFQENLDTRRRDLEYTNRAITNNINDVVPVGIVIQLKPKPDTEYKVLGLGIVKKWEKGFFYIRELT